MPPPRLRWAVILPVVAFFASACGADEPVPVQVLTEYDVMLAYSRAESVVFDAVISFPLVHDEPWPKEVHEALSKAERLAEAASLGVSEVHDRFGKDNPAELLAEYEKMLALVDEAECALMSAHALMDRE